MDQLRIFVSDKKNLVNFKEASDWASKYLKRKITTSNISYLVQYARIKNHGSNGNPLVNLEELKAYYDSFDKEKQWKQKLGDDLNWNLSFVEYKESERTKHVHRLHPYKGKFIPQLVEYFLDDHVDDFKRQVFFDKGDIVLDPFCGSGTTLVQANELGMHAVGIDISAFNAMISNTKIAKHQIHKLKKCIQEITGGLLGFQAEHNNTEFEEHLLAKLSDYNHKWFPSPEYKIKVRRGEINEIEYAKKKERDFLKIYFDLIEKYDIQITQDETDTFLDKWFLNPVREELDIVFNEIRNIQDVNLKRTLAIILSRTARSCRATTHADLGTLKEPVTTTYYCKKHGKICKPIFSIIGWWRRYTVDTIKRIVQFDKLRTDTLQVCLTGDSREMDIIAAAKQKNRQLADLIECRKFKGIFSSPPYVGLIDYHEQHAYSYEIFGFERRDHKEIGPLSKGQGKEARDSYIEGIAAVLINCKKYLVEDYNVFLVANDKFNLYPDIAKLAEMEIVNRYKRPVLNRVEKDRTNAYSEIIFHFKEK